MLSDSCLVIAGEKSAEEHFLSFRPSLMATNPNLKLYGVGGDVMKDNGVEIIYHLKDFSSVGLSEVIFKIPFYKKALDRIVQEVLKRQTKTALLIDFQGFNLKLAQKLAKHNIKILYYVAPQAWVWKQWRARILGECVHTLFTILPFEKEWFSKRGVGRVIGIPHPLMINHKKALESYQPKTYPKNKKWNILLLPGSRNAEVPSHMPVFLKALKNLCSAFSIEIGLVKTTSVNEGHYSMYEDEVDVLFHSHELEKALVWSHLAVASSGTVTLSCGLFQVPTVVAYKTTLLNAFVFDHFISYRGAFSLPNIILEDWVYPEFLQGECQAINIEVSLRRWLDHAEHYNNTVELLGTLKNKLTGDDIDVGDYMGKVIQGIVT